MTEKYIEPSAADIIIRNAAEEYIDYAAESGLLTRSDLYIDPKTLIVRGATHLTTESGVRIFKNNLGYLELKAEFEGGADVDFDDIVQEMRLFPGLLTEITERVGGGNTKTIAKRDHERMALEMAHLIKAIY